MLGEQRDDAVSVHVVAARVASGNAVGVAIVDEQGIVAQLAHFREAFIDPRLNGLGMQPGKGGVLRVVDFHDLHAHVAQKASQIVAAGAVKRIAHHAQVGAADGLDVDQLAQGGQVVGHEVGRLEGAENVRRLGRQHGFDAVGELGGARAAVGHAQLHAQILGGVMGAREHDAAHRVVVMGHRPAQRGRGAIVLGEQHVEALACGHLRGQLGIGVGVLAAIMADDEHTRGLRIAASGHGLLLEDAGRRRDDAVQIVGREIFADDGAPAVGSKMNVSHEQCLLGLFCEFCCENDYRGCEP